MHSHKTKRGNAVATRGTLARRAASCLLPPSRASSRPIWGARPIALTLTISLLLGVALPGIGSRAWAQSSQAGQGTAVSATTGSPSLSGGPSVPVSDPTKASPASTGQPGISTSQPQLLPDLARADPVAAAKAAAVEKAAANQAPASDTAVATTGQVPTPGATPSGKAAGPDTAQANGADVNASAQTLATAAATTSSTGADDDLQAIASESGLATKAEPASFNGSFTHNVSIAVPAFHGLEPQLSLRYDSNGGARAGGYWAGLAGVGFQVSGLSDIVRASAVGGTPTHAATDEFVLDGDRLVPCAAGMTSPACTTGTAATGVSYYATRVESFNRIKRIVDGSGNSTWQVTGRDGTVSTYVSPASVPAWYANGATPSTDPQLSGDTRWLLRSVTDTHGNAVSYDYSCAGDPVCWPASISYNGSRIDFSLEATSGPAALGTATGKSLASLNQRISAIAITTNGERVRGYNLDYDSSPASGYSRLAAVTQFGRDAVLDSGRFSGGTSLPPTQLTWSGQDLVSSAWSKYNNPDFSFPRVETNADVNNDGIPDLWKFTSTTQQTVNGSSTCRSLKIDETASPSQPAKHTSLGLGCTTSQESLNVDCLSRGSNPRL